MVEHSGDVWVLDHRGRFRCAVAVGLAYVWLRNLQMGERLMVTEVVEIDINEGDEDAFVRAFEGVLPELAGTEGCRAVRLARGVEAPSRFMIFVDWDSVEAHLENFAKTDRAARWRAGVGPFFAGKPRVGHFAEV